MTAGVILPRSDGLPRFKLLSKGKESLMVIGEWCAFKRIVNLVRPLIPRGPASESKILIELTGQKDLHVVYLLFCAALQSETRFAIEGFKITPPIEEPAKSMFVSRRMRDLLLSAAGKGINPIFFIMGVSRQVRHSNLSAMDQILIDAKMSELHDYSRKKQFLDIELLGVPIGELIYDSYLRRYNVPTIEIGTKNFNLHCLRALELCLRWIRYFDDNSIAYVVGGAPYLQGIPGRVAAVRNIPFYSPGRYSEASHRLSASQPRVARQAVEYRQIFNDFSEEYQRRALNQARGELEDRYSSAAATLDKSTSPFTAPFTAERQVIESDSLKVLVATHEFADAPNALGPLLYPDFFEWLEALGRLSKKTKFDWYLKIHPNAEALTEQVVSGFLARHNQWRLIRGNVNHKQLVSEGIERVLTVYGTIGVDMAALGIPVVNACGFSRRGGYTFNLDPKSRTDYEKSILNLDKLDHAIDQKEVAEFHYMDNIFNRETFITPGGGQSYATLTKLLTDSEAVRYSVARYRSFIDSESYWMMPHDDDHLKHLPARVWG